MVITVLPTISAAFLPSPNEEAEPDKTLRRRARREKVE